MCFSAEVSFTAAGALALIGTATLKNFSNKNYFFLAAIPFLFALQQLSEGILWTQLNQGSSNSFLSTIAARSFLVFVFLIWPIWIPLSLAMIEKMTWRRNIIYLILACGIVLSSTNLYYALHQNIQINIINHSIQYLVPAQMALAYPLPLTLAYPFIVILPIFISSIYSVWIFGVLISIAYIVAVYLYSQTYISVWCFFDALLSLILYKVLKDNANKDEAMLATKEKH